MKPIKFQHSALRLALIYAILSTLWILFSDRGLLLLNLSPEKMTALQSYKGGGFILVSAILIYYLAAREIGRITTHLAEKTKTELMLYRLNRALRVLSDCNQVLIRAEHEQMLLSDICERIVESGGYRLAWVGFVEYDANKTVRPVVFYGYEAQYLDTVYISWADTEHGRSPVGTAIRTGKPSISQNIATNPNFAPWREEALKRGYAASIALPLIVEGRTLGSLNIYAVEPSAFDEEEVNLLVELANDLAYGIMALRLRVNHNHTVKALHASEERYRRLFNNVNDAVFVYHLSTTGQPENFIEVNDVACTQLGYTKEEFRSMSPSNLAKPNNTQKIPSIMQSYQTKNHLVFDWVHVAKDGTEIEVELNAHLFELDNKPTVLTIARDITRRKKTEMALQQAHAELTQAYDETLKGWARALELRDYETEAHSQRVVQLSLQLAQAMGIHDETELLHLQRGALLHDIGKIGVPDAILLKPGPLTDEEWCIMRKHPVYAYDMLKSINYLRPALDIPYCHHEQWNGMGYPRGLKGEEIPLPARIFSVVDVWDALCSDRPYRPGWPKSKVLSHIRKGVGTSFDPEVATAFLSMIDTLITDN